MHTLDRPNRRAEEISRTLRGFAIVLPDPVSWTNLRAAGWDVDGEAADFGGVVAREGAGEVYSGWGSMATSDAEVFAANVVAACRVTGLQPPGALKGAGFVIELPTPDPRDAELHECGYTYFGDVGARKGEPRLLIRGEFAGVGDSWSQALSILAAVQLARSELAA